MDRLWSQESSLIDSVRGLLDLGIISLVTVLTGSIVLQFGPETVPLLTLLLVLLLVFFLPGYACILALKPQRTSREEEKKQDQYGLLNKPESGLAYPERIILAIGASVGISTLTGFVLHFSGIGINTKSTCVALSTVTLLGCAVATVRRYRLPVESSAAKRNSTGPIATLRSVLVVRTRMDSAITLLILLGLAITIVSTGFIAVSADGQSSYTELYILGENESDQPVAGEYRAEDVGNMSLRIGVENHEGEKRDYTLVVQFQQLEDNTIIQYKELGRSHRNIPANGTWQSGYSVPANSAETGGRLQFLLYTGSAPDDPNQENAYRSVHIWIEAQND